MDAEAERSTSALQRPTARARQLLGEMLHLADIARHQPDAKARALLHWIRENQCPGVGFGQSKLAKGAGPWGRQRLIIFTEYADTKRYLTELSQGRHREYRRRRVQGIQRDTRAVLDQAERATFHEQTAKEELESQRATIDKLKRETDEAGRIRERSAKVMQFSSRWEWFISGQRRGCRARGHKAFSALPV